MVSQTLFMSIFGGIIFLLLMSMSSFPVFNGADNARKRLRNRIKDMAEESQEDVSQLVQKARLQRLSPLARKLEELPQLEFLHRLIVHSGENTSAMNVLLFGVILGSTGLSLGILFLDGLATLCCTVAGLFAPILYLMYKRNKRMDMLESQISEALDLMKRSLQAGHPFIQSLKVISEEMPDPIAREFGLAFMDINYGSSVEAALNALLERAPSITLMALVTSINVQRESGGNLAEILDNINGVLRGRFKFQRKLKTLSAEGRISAWALTFIPLFLFGLLYVVSPDYIANLTDKPEGQNLLRYAAVGMTIGVYWMRRIIRKVEV